MKNEEILEKCGEGWYAHLKDLAHESARTVTVDLCGLSSDFSASLLLEHTRQISDCMLGCIYYSETFNCRMMKLL